METELLSAPVPGVSPLFLPSGKICQRPPPIMFPLAFQVRFLQEVVPSSASHWAAFEGASKGAVLT